MSTYEELYEDAQRDAWYEQLYEEHRAQALVEFRAERLVSYYGAHKDVAQIASEVLSDAIRLQEISPSAALTRAITASELGVKNMLLRPIVHGLVHSETLAGAISDLVVGHHAVSRYRDLLVSILSEYGGVDLNTYTRPAAQETLLRELGQLQEVRNSVVHKGLTPTTKQRDAAIGIADAIIHVIFPQVVGRLGFHLHDETLCDDPHVAEALARLARNPAD